MTKKNELVNENESDNEKLMITIMLTKKISSKHGTITKK